MTFLETGAQLVQVISQTGSATYTVPTGYFAMVSVIRADSTGNTVTIAGAGLILTGTQLIRNSLMYEANALVTSVSSILVQNGDSIITAIGGKVMIFLYKKP